MEDSRSSSSVVEATGITSPRPRGRRLSLRVSTLRRYQGRFFYFLFFQIKKFNNYIFSDVGWKDSA